MTRTCVALFSGGLDSLLSVAMMAGQGIGVVALHTRNCFHGTEDWDAKAAVVERRALAAGAARFVVRDLTGEVVALVKRNRHGYGKNLNPCIDCRGRTVLEGRRLAEECGADFLVTGEVLGQRPMSQRRDALAVTDRMLEETGFAGRLVRPLCARCLPATLPETEGWIDRAKLGDCRGRGRHWQMEMAARVGVEDYPSPAGGCLLTDAGFCGRLADLAIADPDWSAAGAELLKIGRHYRTSPRTKIIASRNETENHLLARLLPAGTPLFAASGHEGAYVALVGEAAPEAEELAAGMAIYFSRQRAEGRGAVAGWNAGAAADKRRDLGVHAAARAERLAELQVAGTPALAAGLVRRYRDARRKNKASSENQ